MHSHTHACTHTNAGHLFPLLGSFKGYFRLSGGFVASTEFCNDLSLTDKLNCSGWRCRASLCEFWQSDRPPLNSARLGPSGFKRSSLRYHAVTRRLSCSVTQTHTVDKAELDTVLGCMRNTRRLPVSCDFSYRRRTLGVTNAFIWTQPSRKKPCLTCFVWIIYKLLSTRLLSGYSRLCLNCLSVNTS